MPTEGENLLWLRVAALRGIEIPERGARASVEGERFRVQVTRRGAPKSTELSRLSQLVSDPSCRGVIGEIVVERAQPPRRRRVPTARGLGNPRPDWRIALLEQEAARLARHQPDRRSP
jgi:hypothetical protein